MDFLALLGLGEWFGGGVGGGGGVGNAIGE